MNGRQRRRLLCSMAAGLIRASPAAGASLALPYFVSGSPCSGLPRHVQPAAIPAAAAAAPAPPPAAAAAPSPPSGAAGRPVSAATRGRGSGACPGGSLSSASLRSVPPRRGGAGAGLPSPGGEGDKGRRARVGGRGPRSGQSLEAPRGPRVWEGGRRPLWGLAVSPQPSGEPCPPSRAAVPESPWVTRAARGGAVGGWMLRAERRPSGRAGQPELRENAFPCRNTAEPPQQTRALYCFIVELKLSIYLLSLPGSPGLGAMIELISAVAPALRLWLSTVGQGGDGEKSCFVCERRKDICQKITTVFLKNARCKTTWI